VALSFRDAADRHDGGFVLRGEVPTDDSGFANALYQTVGARLQAGHDVRLADNGAVFDVLVGRIGAAKKSIHAVMYIWHPGKASERLLEALAERTRAGVRCRVLADDLGSFDFEKVKPRLEAIGCEAHVMRPMGKADDELARNHRKIWIFDGEVALTGGFGIRDEWLGDGVTEEQWRDSNILFSGPSVTDAQQAFAENWQETTGALLPAEDFPRVSPAGRARAAFVASSGSPVISRAERLMQLAMASARRRIWLANAYFVPTRAMIETLGTKARAGVDVRVLVPGKKNDSKTSQGAQQLDYDELLAAGVRVWEYLPTMMHSKSLLADEDRVVVGSINLDPISLNKVDEAALVVVDAELAASVGEAFERDLEHARELKRE